MVSPIRRRLTSREYRLFKGAHRRDVLWYERLVGATSKMVKVSPGKESRQNLENAIRFSGMRITPEGVMGLFVFTIISLVLVSVLLAVLGLIQPIGIILVSAFGLLLGYYFLKYPANLVKALRIRASSQVVLAVLYMVISMRMSPNLERAMRFAASNISGPLAWDMRRLLWDIELGKHYSAHSAMDYYIAKWKPENEEFSEAMRLIRDSESQIREKARITLDAALDLVLEGTKTRMKHYAEDLRLPVTVIHMMGIALPVLGTIMAPLAAVFISDLFRPEHFIIGYDIVLPIILVWFINTTLKKRPVTFSEINITSHPSIPRPGHFRAGKAQIPVLPISLLVLVAFLAYPVLYFYQSPNLLLPMPSESGSGFENIEDPDSLFTLAMSLMIVLGVGFALSVHFLLSNYQAMGVRGKIQKIEGEFELALFQLGNRISGGTPTEVAIEKSIADVKDLKIAGLFRRTLNNMRTLGMTMESALLDRRYGALKFYPSKLIRNIMLTFVATAKKGVTYAAESMLRISKYLTNIRTTQEYIRELLSETVSSMKFQAYFLTPLITGLIVSMADIIIQILSQLGRFMENAGFGEQLGVDFAAIALGAPAITPAMFQLIVGAYLIEVILILSMFLTKIGEGENKSAQWYSAGKMLVVAVVVYFIIALTASSIFGDLIRQTLGSIINP